MRHISLAVSASLLALAGCKLNVDNPTVIDASKFNPNADGVTLALSAQTNFYKAFQSVALNGGLIADEGWTGAIRIQTNHVASRTFLGEDDINLAFFFPLSLATVSNGDAAKVLAVGAAAATDSNLARASMNAGFSFVLQAETMCRSDVRRGPALTDAQLLDSAISWFGKAVTVGTAIGASAQPIVDASNVGLARAHLQKGDYAGAATAAALVTPGFKFFVITSANPATHDSLGNIMYATGIQTQLLAPKLYRFLMDPRVPIDSSLQSSVTATNGLPLVLQAKFTAYDAPIRLASDTEAQFIAAEAALHGSSNTGPALTLIGAERAKGNQGPYGGATDTLSVLTELLNQRAREFWLEGKKLGDLRRNPSVPLAGVLTDATGAAYYGQGAATFGDKFCVPIPPEETGANPNLH